MDAKKNARRFVRILDKNSKDWTSGAVTYEQFSSHQSQAWDAIHNAGRDVEDAVMSILRKRLNSIEKMEEAGL